MILRARLKGAQDGQFQNIEVPHRDIDAFAFDLNEGELIVCKRLYTRAAGESEREIIHRSDIAVCKEGIDWLMTPTVRFIEGQAA